MKDLRAARRLLFLCTFILFGIAVSSCQSPQAQPAIHTPQRYDTYMPIPLAGKGRADVHHLTRFFTATNPHIDIDRLGWIVRLYIHEAEIEGINHDIAFVQMVHETDYLRFTGDVSEWQNNFGGLGATGNGEPGLSFSTVHTGIRAHIQHLKAYANTRPLNNPRVDPRFHKVNRAQAPYLNGLTGTWAMDPQYSKKLKQKLEALESHLTPTLHTAY